MNLTLFSSVETDRIECTVPFETHAHFRGGNMLSLVIWYTIRQFCAAIGMPNVPPLFTTADAEKLLQHIDLVIDEYCKKHSIPRTSIDFKPLLTCYLRDNTSIVDLTTGYQKEIFHAAKLYPVGATTGSDKGVSDITNIIPVLRAMAEMRMPLCIHGEKVTNSNNELLDPFGETESAFLDTLEYMINQVPNLRIHLEHVSTEEQVDFVLSHANVYATVTPTHLLFNRAHLLHHNGVRKYDTRKMMLPTLKLNEDIEAIVAGIKQAPHKFACGTDTAPHDVKTKGDETGGCNCGCFNAPTALEMYASAFEHHGILKCLPVFLTNGWIWYNTEPPKKNIVLERTEIMVPHKVTDGTITVIPLESGQTLPWKLVQPANDITITTAVY